MSVRLAARWPFVTPSLLFVSGLHRASPKTSWHTKRELFPWSTFSTLEELRHCALKHRLRYLAASSYLHNIEKACLITINVGL